MKSNARSKPEDQEHGTERWLISYADFITLMFAFFVILYATSERDLDKTKKFQESVDKYLVKAGAFGETGAKVAPGEKNFSVIDPPIQTFRPNKPDDMAVYNSLEDAIASKLTDQERHKYLLDMAPEDRGVRLVLKARDIYSGDSAKFAESAMPFVNHLASVLKEQKKRLLVEGHVAPGRHGNFASTWDLASARAINFLRYLQAKYNWNEGSLASASFGSSKSSSQTKDSGNNDRIELLVFYNDSEF